MIEAKNISYSIANNFLVKDVSLSVADNDFVVIMGANGAGKSTLLKMLAGSLQPSSGQIFIDKKIHTQYTAQELAVKRAVLSQHYNIIFPSTAKDIVMMGRYPYFASNPSIIDEEIVTQAMQQMQIENFATRDYNTLSGGEAQKVQMSRVLAQIAQSNSNKKKILFLDEPVSSLDVKYQHQLLSVAKQLCQNNVTVVAVLHDINLAIKYATSIVFMKQAQICHTLHQTKNITAAIINTVFDVDATIIYDQANNPVVVF